MMYFTISLYAVSILVVISLFYIGLEVYDRSKAFIKREDVKHTWFKKYILFFPVALMISMSEDEDIDYQYVHSPHLYLGYLELKYGSFISTFIYIFACIVMSLLWPVLLISVFVAGIMIYLRHQNDLKKKEEE